MSAAIPARARRRGVRVQGWCVGVRARRPWRAALGADPIVLLAAVREGVTSALDQVGLPELRLGALDEPAAAALLDHTAPDLAPAVRMRVLAEAAGNPLALAELPTALRSEHLLTG